GGTKNAVAECRSLWCDWDGIEVDEALRRCEHNRLPTPTVVVSSGHGVHGYWLLTESVEVSEPAQRATFECRLRHLCQSLGGDATQDVSRMMRMPGFLNVKGRRQGCPPAPCKLVLSSPESRYELTVCERWSVRKPVRSPHASHASGGEILGSRMAARIRGL